MSSNRSVVLPLGRRRTYSSSLWLTGCLGLLVCSVGLWAADARPEREVAVEEEALPRDERLAVFLDGELGWRPISWPLDRNSDTRWREVVYSPHRGLRSHLLIEDVVRGPGISASFSGEEITGLWFDALQHTDRFVVERQRGEAPAARSQGAYWLEARLAAEAGTSRRADQGIVFGIRLVDGATGQVRLSFESRILEVDGALDGISESGGESFMDDGMELAARRKLEGATHKAAYGLARWFAEHPWRSAVSAVEAGGVRLAAGREHGLEVGMLLRVLAPGEVVIDPESGESIGSITRPVGRLQVKEVEERSALAEVLSGRRILQAGYQVDREIPDPRRDHG